MSIIHPFNIKKHNIGYFYTSFKCISKRKFLEELYNFYNNPATSRYWLFHQAQLTDYNSRIAQLEGVNKDLSGDVVAKQMASEAALKEIAELKEKLLWVLFINIVSYVIV